MRGLGFHVELGLSVDRGLSIQSVNTARPDTNFGLIVTARRLTSVASGRQLGGLSKREVLVRHKASGTAFGNPIRAA